jgi:hypothetical protein
MAGTDYIDKEAYYDQVNKLNVRYPTLDQLVQNDALIDHIKDLQIKSIKRGKEDLFIRCGNKLFKPPVLYESEDRAIFLNQPKKIQKICKNEPYSLIHFHGIAYGYHSAADKAVHRNMFDSYFATSGEVVGIDGIHSQTFLNHNIKIPWSSKFYDELSKHNITVINDVRSVFCTKLNKTYRECTINLLNNQQSIKNVFTKINFEESSLENSYYPYRSLNKKNSERISNIEYDGKKTTCVISSNKNERYLSCFYQPINID